MGTIVAATGHRPPRLGLGYDKTSRITLWRFAKQTISAMSNKPELIISGGAQGWDQAIAAAAIVLKIPLHIYVPFKGQESQWPDEAKEIYHRMLDKSQQVVIVSPGEYANSKFHIRDKAMVDNSDIVLALLDDKPESSGTLQTVRYAIKKNKHLMNVYNDWREYLSNNPV